MVEYCLCRPANQHQEIMTKVEKAQNLDHPFSFRISTGSGTRNYDAYECKHCGRLQLFRVSEPSERQKKLVTA